MTLVKITPEEYNTELYIAYATEDNFTERKLYKNGHCYLHEAAAKAFETAVSLASAIGYKFKIFDAFRPLEVQQMLWDDNPDPEFISDPVNGKTPHCRGIALDLTLIDQNSNELDMGTGFDAFTPLSHHGKTEISDAAQKNRYILLSIMKLAGFDHNPREWWHYQLPNWQDYKKYTDSDAGTKML